MSNVPSWMLSVKVHKLGTFTLIVLPEILSNIVRYFMFKQTLLYEQWINLSNKPGKMPFRKICVSLIELHLCISIIKGTIQWLFFAIPGENLFLNLYINVWTYLIQNYTRLICTFFLHKYRIKPRICRLLLW